MQAAVISQPVRARPATIRSKVTNGRASYVEGNGNSAWARRWRDLIELHLADLGPVETLSEAQISLVRRVATIEIELEAAEGRLSKGEDVDLDAYTRASGHLRRILETIGLKRLPKDVTPDLRDYIAAHAREAAE